jgi:predicted nucleic acid-binding protein
LNGVLNEDLQGRILPFDSLAADRTAALMGMRHRAGRPRDLRDTMIAGIALAHGAGIATRNVQHFDDLTTPVVNPWQS